MFTFDQYWEIYGVHTAQPAVFDLAMKEVASQAWNRALEEATAIANTVSDQNRIMEAIENLKV